MESPEAILSREVATLDLQKSSLVLSISELRLSHERSVRLRAIEIARAMILDKKQQLGMHSSEPSAAAVEQPVHQLESRVWCQEAAKRFNMTLPIKSPSDWGSMSAPVYRNAWISHLCEQSLSSPPVERRANDAAGPARAVQTNPELRVHHTDMIPAHPTFPRAFSYLKAPSDSGAGKRRKVTVVVWNKIRGFLDWLRPDFTNAARDQCSTECIFTDDKGSLNNADGVLFHAKTHSMQDFPRRAKAQQKYVINFHKINALVLSLP